MSNPMTYTQPPKVSECVRILADRRRTPDAHAHKVDETILALVQSFSRHFAMVAGDQRAEKEPFWHALDRVKNRADSMREKCAISCLADTNATAALVKEIAFTPVPLNEDGSFVSVDLGAGTGVLSVGAAIAGLRSDAAEIILKIVDIESDLLERARKTLGCVGNHVEIESHVGDIAQRPVYTQFNPHRVRYWISETISQGTPQAKVIEGHVVWLEQGTHRAELDPYPYVIHHLTQMLPDLPELLAHGRSRLFPDLFTGQYHPGVHEALQLTSSKSHQQHGPLGTVGRDFFRLNYEQTGGARW